ncbi:MAG: hypothetical protein N2Z21_08070 [Candidatus Sumerlaeaceae bacterium]|nr:hypothetical protein [Candidatus Sumerlaeaceae bacterium]
MRTFFRGICLAAVAILLSGCASKNPIDYLPQGKLYFAVNAMKFNSQSGCKRLAEISKKFGPQDVVADQVEMGYLCLSDLRPVPSIYLLIITKPGAAPALLSNVAKSAKTTPVKVGGLSGYRVAPREETAQSARGEMVLVQLSDSAVLGAASDKDIETMIRTARKKVPHAAGTPEFRKCQQLASASPIALVADVTQFTAGISPTSLGPLAKANPKAAEALQKLQLVSMTANWDQQPEVELTAYTPDETASRDLATLFNFVIGLQREKLPPVIQNIAAKQAKEGLVISLQIPKEKGDEWLAALEQTVANLPSDPAKRGEAFVKTLPSLLR